MLTTCSRPAHDAGQTPPPSPPLSPLPDRSDRPAPNPHADPTLTKALNAYTDHSLRPGPRVIGNNTESRATGGRSRGNSTESGSSRAITFFTVSFFDIPGDGQNRLTYILKASSHPSALATEPTCNSHSTHTVNLVTSKTSYFLSSILSHTCTLYYDEAITEIKKTSRFSIHNIFST